MLLGSGTWPLANPLNGSADGFRFERADYRPCVHDVRRIEGSLDAAHRGNAAGVAVFLQKMPFETADAMLRAERAPERRGRVVQPERQAAFDKSRELDPIGTPGSQHIVVQIAVAHVTVDGKLEVGAIVPHLLSGNVQKALDGRQGHGYVVLDRSAPPFFALRNRLAQLPHGSALSSALREVGVLDPSGFNCFGKDGFHEDVEIELARARR